MKREKLSFPQRISITLHEWKRYTLRFLQGTNHNKQSQPRPRLLTDLRESKDKINKTRHERPTDSVAPLVLNIEDDDKVTCNSDYPKNLLVVEGTKESQAIEANS